MGPVKPRRIRAGSEKKQAPPSPTPPQQLNPIPPAEPGSQTRIHLQWPHRGCYLVPLRGQELFLDPQAVPRDPLLDLWLSPRRVLETHYCLSLDRVPAQFYEEIAANPAQCEEWVRLYAIDRLARSLMEPGFSQPLTARFLQHHSFLMLDTAFFRASFVERLLAAMPDFSAQLDGLLIHGDNFAAMQWLATEYTSRVDCIYTDPPYNTGGTELTYRDRYGRANWLTMMDNRFRLAYPLLKPGGACFVSIDENEQAALELLLSEIFRPEDFVASLVWEAGRKNDSKLVSVSHEYMLCYVKNLADVGQKRLTWRVRKEGIDEIYNRARHLVRRCAGDYRKASVLLRRWLAGLPENHPARRHRHYSCVDERGVYHAGNISWPGGGGPTYPVLHPTTGKPCKIPSRGWMYPNTGRMEEAIRQGLVHFGPDETRVPCAKVYLKENEHHAPASVFYRDGRAAMKRLRDILGADLFSNPKDESVIAEKIGLTLPPDGIVLDPFAGSGSTAHAVLQLNRADGGRRHYILCEIGDAFDAVLRTRLQRIAYSRRWRRGLPVDRDGMSHAFKYIRLESFEDAVQKEKAGQ